jgi:hypothetical protein
VDVSNNFCKQFIIIYLQKSINTNHFIYPSNHRLTKNLGEGVVIVNQARHKACLPDLVGECQSGIAARVRK